MSFFFFFTFFWQLHKQAVLKYKYTLHYSPFKGESNGNCGMQRAWCEWCGASWWSIRCSRSATLGSGMWCGKGTAPIPGHQEDGMWVEREQLVFGSSERPEPPPMGHGAVFIQNLLRFQLPTSIMGIPLGPGIFWGVVGICGSCQLRV